MGTKFRDDLSAEYVRERLSYDADTGVFRWLKHWRKPRIGEIAGGYHDEYVQIYLAGKPYLAHRLAWVHHFGEWPIGQLDHRDGDKANNRIRNLRPATHAQNQQNQTVFRRTASGIKGVRFIQRTGKWEARIQANTIAHSLGYFSSPQEAQAAYAQAALALHGEFARLN